MPWSGWSEWSPSGDGEAGWVCQPAVVVRTWLTAT
jgi:hypothetical protein